MRGQDAARDRGGLGRAVVGRIDPKSVQRILKSKGVWSVSDLDDRVVEAILGPELTRKLDDYIAREEVQNLQRKRWTRLEVIRVAWRS